MRAWGRQFILIAGLAISTGAAHAGDLADFNKAVAAAYAPYRDAVSYLRTENVALAAFELDDVIVKWRDVTMRFAAAAPDAFADDPTWEATLRGIGTRLDDALSAIDAGDDKAALQTLAPIRGELGDLRARNGVVVFSDRVNEVSAAMDALWVYFSAAPDLASAEIARDITAKMAVLTYVVGRCREQAPADLREDETFIRLIDGLAEGTGRIGRALDERNQNRLSVILGELRSFERILFLRFG